MRKKRHKIFLVCIIFWAVIIVCLFNRKNNIMNYVGQDQSGLYYDDSQIDLFSNAQADFYTTLFVNRFKKLLSHNWKNAQMRDMEGYNLNNFTCIRQLVNNDYEFNDDEIEMIEEYLYSIQEDKKFYLIWLEKSDENYSEENSIFLTYEALIIAEKLNLELHGIHKIKEYINTLSIQNKSCKETMAILGIRELLHMEQYSVTEIQEVYSKLFESWYESDSSQIFWYFDLYYLSYIYDIGKIDKDELTSTFREDIIGLISNDYINLTLKNMGIEILQNYNLIDQNVENSIKQLVKKYDKQCSLKDGKYAMLNIKQGDISTTYYVYLCNKMLKSKKFKASDLKITLKDIFTERKYRQYSNQELYQIIYLGKELNCISLESKKELLLYLSDEIQENKCISDIYFILQSIITMSEENICLEKEQMDIVNEIVQQEQIVMMEEKSEIYDRMLSLFFIVEIKSLLNESNIDLSDISYKELLSESELYIEKDIRILYFYYMINKQLNSEFEISDQLLEKLKKRGLYSLNQSNKKKSTYIQYLGLRIEKYDENICLEMPII